MPKLEKLSDKHLKAISLISEARLKIKEIAKVCNMSVESLYDLVEHNPKCGPVGELFWKELEKITRKNSELFKSLLKESKVLAMRKINDFMKDYQNAKIDLSEAKEIATILSHMGKAGAGVEIGEVHTHYNLTPEEMSNEFRRLQGLARDTISGGIQRIAERGAGVLPATPGTKGSVDQE